MRQCGFGKVFSAWEFVPGSKRWHDWLLLWYRPACAANSIRTTAMLDKTCGPTNVNLGPHFRTLCGRWDGIFSGVLLCNPSWLSVTDGICCRPALFALSRYSKNFYVIDVVWPFLSTISSALEDNASSPSVAFVPVGSTRFFLSIHFLHRQWLKQCSA